MTGARVGVTTGDGVGNCIGAGVGGRVVGVTTMDGVTSGDGVGNCIGAGTGERVVDATSMGGITPGDGMGKGFCFPLPWLPPFLELPFNSPLRNRKRLWSSILVKAYSGGAPETVVLLLSTK